MQLSRKQGGEYMKVHKKKIKTSNMQIEHLNVALKKREPELTNSSSSRQQRGTEAIGPRQ